jgi:hypothetical protein
MPVTYTHIASTTLASSQSTVTLSSIPSTYTDLMVLCSIKGDRQVNADPLEIVLNGTASGYSYTTLLTVSGGITPGRGSADSRIYLDALVPQAFFNATNLFNNVQVYLANYAGNKNKTLNVSGGFTSVNNASQTAIMAASALSTNTSAITSITFQGNGYVAGSSFYLYGIKNS